MKTGGGPVLSISRDVIYIACEEMNFIWSEEEVNEFINLWNSGIDILSIAEHFNRDPDEVGLLVIDQARNGSIASRHTLPNKGESHKVIAKVEKMKNNQPTVITIHGMRFVLEHPNQGRAKHGPSNTARQSAQR